MRAYQLKTGLIADGVAGSKTLKSLAGGDCQLLLKNHDLVNAAQRPLQAHRNIYTCSNVDIAIDYGIIKSLLSPVRSDSVRWLLG